MADDGDRAARRAEVIRDEALARLKMRPRRPVREFCLDCGEEIDEGRRKALEGVGVLRCVECQQQAERRR